MFELMLSAYSTINIQDAAQFLGMSEEDATNCKYTLRLLHLCCEVSVILLLDVLHKILLVAEPL